MSSFADIGRLLLYQTPKSCDSVLIRGRLLLEPPLVPNLRREPARKDRLRLYGAFESVEICKGIILFVDTNAHFPTRTMMVFWTCLCSKKTSQQKAKNPRGCNVRRWISTIESFSSPFSVAGLAKQSKEAREYLTKKTNHNSINRECFAH